MSLFKPSSETAKAPVSKILLWGPQGAGKTHFMMGAPKLALLDIENRARNFAVRQTEFSFAHAEVQTLSDFALAVKEIRSGKLDCDSVGVDSGSALYLKLVEEHTEARETDRGIVYVTDWVTVNRRFLTSLNFVFSVAGKNLLYSMHAATKLVRQGREFRIDGMKFVGNEQFRYGFDYIFRIEPKGDPTKAPPLFHVEKTSSPGIRLGEAISGLTFPQFGELTDPSRRVSLGSSNGKPPAAHSTPASSAAQNVPSIEPKLRKVAILRDQLGLNHGDLGVLVLGVCNHRTQDPRQLDAGELDQLIDVLERRRTAVTA